MPKFSAEGTVGLLIDIVVILVGELRPTSGWVVWPFFALGIILIADWIFRGDWGIRHAEGQRRREKWGFSVALLLLGGVAAALITHRLSTLERVAISQEAQKEQEHHPLPSTQEVAGNLLPEKQSIPIRHVPRRKIAKVGAKSTVEPSSAPQENNDGQNNMDTQITKSQAPVALAPNGIANAAPNLGTQTVNNFGELPSPPLVLTDEQCQSITHALEPFKSQLIHLEVVGSMIDDPFGKKLKDAIEAAGLTVDYHETFALIVMGIGTPPPGISFGFGEKRKDILQVMASQFHELGLVNKPIKAFDAGTDGDAPNVFVIYITPLD